MRRRRSYELWSALGAMVLITLLYVWVVIRYSTVPPASDLLGHSLGIVGFLLMLTTETLYSLRKRSLRARWGRMSSWLRFHIFTGLVGPYLVLLHTAWKFNGLAGVVAALTLVVVLSGMVGRYIYTAVPRTADGALVEAAELEREIAAADAELQRWLANRPEADQQMVQRLAALPDPASGGPLLILGRTFSEWEYRLALWRERQGMGTQEQTQAREMDRLLRQRRSLRRQMASLTMARRMLATWHTIHIPIGMVLFTAAFVHIGAAIYYATLLK
jgi:hypothetical protein